MASVSMLTLDRRSLALPLEAFEPLRSELRGELLFPLDPGYEPARRIWNAMIDRRPGCILRAAGTADVMAGVRFAAEHDLLLSVRGGGHNVAGNAVCDGGLMLDLSGMRAVQVDPVRRRARAQGGATWGDFDAETQAFGLATTGGLISETGVAGLTLGGGIGWLSPSYGLACDNLVSLELVTAEGKLVTASTEENADLFWGLKGGGGNFGVVTSFEFRLHPVGPLVYAGMLLYPIEEAEACLVKLRDFMRGAPDSLAALGAITTLPDGRPVAGFVAVHNGPVEEGEALLAPWRGWGQPLVDSLGPTPYRKIQTVFDAGAPKGLRYYWKSSFLDSLPDEALAAIAARGRARSSLKSKIFVEFLGGALHSLPREATVFEHRGSPYNLLIIGGWDDAGDDAVNRQWARETWQALQPYASEGVYVNYLGTEADEEGNRVPLAFGAEKYAKLVALKRKYDPGNLFRMNQNIRPE